NLHLIDEGVAHSGYRSWRRPIRCRHLYSGDSEFPSLVLEAFLNHAAYGNLLAKLSQPVMAHMAAGVNPRTHAEVTHQDIVGHTQQALGNSNRLLSIQGYPNATQVQ